jgi:hypothetical protein
MLGSGSLITSHFTLALFLSSKLADVRVLSGYDRFRAWTLVCPAYPGSTKTQSYDCELQRQRCKKFNAMISLVRFENKKYFLLL